MITLADQKYHFPDFPTVIINTGDKDIRKEYFGVKVLSYSTCDNDYSLACPDFVFDHWGQVGLFDYENICSELSRLGKQDPETNMLGWRGALTHPNRNLLTQYHDGVNIDAIMISWKTGPRGKLECNDYVSLPDHPKRWRYLIDVEGVGYSGRVKVFLFSRRVLFLQDRPFKEYYYPKMKPWIHYIPVKRDMSDLIENLNIIRKDRNMAKLICEESYNFASTHLTRDACLLRWNELLGGKFNLR